MQTAVTCLFVQRTMIGWKLKTKKKKKDKELKEKYELNYKDENKDNNIKRKNKLYGPNFFPFLAISHLWNQKQWKAKNVKIKSQKIDISSLIPNFQQPGFWYQMMRKF